jgi:TRAP-type C4-dicarboxylate transport system permease small subunit
LRPATTSAIVDVTQIYGTAPILAAALFTGVLGWDALNAFLFWRATADGESLRAGRFGKVDTAFAVGLGLWAVMMLADEFFLSFKVGPFEQTHRSIFVGMLVSFLAVRLLPRD